MCNLFCRRKKNTASIEVQESPDLTKRLYIFEYTGVYNKYGIRGDAGLQESFIRWIYEKITYYEQGNIIYFKIEYNIVKDRRLCCKDLRKGILERTVEKELFTKEYVKKMYDSII